MHTAGARAAAGVLLWMLASAIGAGDARRAQRGDPAPGALIDRAADYVAAYVKAFASTVSEERYEQTVVRVVLDRGVLVPERRRVRRVLVSDYLLLQLPGSNEWTPFRDVYSVDGRPIRDRSDRLMNLLLEPDTTAVEQAVRIRDESSRYNIGDVTRDINVPTFALQVLRAEHRGCFAFTSRGRERVDGVDAAVVEYVETARPTMIQGADSEDVPARGRLWIEPDTGAVLRSILETRPARLRSRIEVTYRREPKLEILVPVEMQEHHSLVEQTVTGRATYSKWRRFRVETDTQFKIK